MQKKQTFAANGINRATTKLEKREKQLKGIFDFYCRQQMLVGKKPTFEEIEKEINNLNLGEFMRFCLDFSIPVPKEKVMDIFKRISPNHREISYDKFKEILTQIFIEINRDRVKTLKAKMETINKDNMIGMAVFKDIQKQLITIK